MGAAWLLPIGNVRASEITAFHPPVALTDMTIRDTFGARRKLSEMLGRPTLVIFWDTSCGRCLPDLASLVRVRRTAFCRAVDHPDRGRSNGQRQRGWLILGTRSDVTSDIC